MTGKSKRQMMIADWLRNHRVGSQEELVARLAMKGIAATQATVSRDLEEIGAARVRRDGTVRYVLSGEIDSGNAPGFLDKLLADWVSGIVPAGNLIVLQTPPGSANLVASAIDSAALPEIAGTIAGDDTIFLALRDGVKAASFAKALESRRGG